jgi:Protein of unknown function (DUF3224)
MTTTLDTKLEIKNWDEKPYREPDGGHKLTRAEVVLVGTGDGLESGTYAALMYYRSDGTSSYVTLLHLTATLDGRSGGVVLTGDGTYDGSAATGHFTIVDGTGELEGIRGAAESVSTHADYPYMPLTLRYDLD